MFSVRVVGSPVRVAGSAVSMAEAPPSSPKQSDRDLTQSHFEVGIIKIILKMEKLRQTYLKTIIIS